MKKEHYSNFCTFDIVCLVNVPGHYLMKYGGNYLDRPLQRLQCTKIVFEDVQYNLDLATLLVAAKIASKLHNVTKLNDFM